MVYTVGNFQLLRDNDMSIQCLITEKGWKLLEKKYHLTRQETQLAICIVSGWTNREAAKAMGITANTVYVHQKKLFAKVRVRNRTELALTFIQETLPKETLRETGNF
jgi:DNA-binding NarL/FixJ family response regulator